MSLGPCLLLYSLNDGGNVQITCLRGVHRRLIQGQSSPCPERNRPALRRLERKLTLPVACSRDMPLALTTILRPRSSRTLHQTLHGCAYHVRCAIKMKKRIRQQRAQTTFTLRTARGNQQYHCARKPQEISGFSESLEREYHTISHAWSL